MMLGDTTLVDIREEVYALWGVDPTSRLNERIRRSVNRLYSRLVKSQKWPTLMQVDPLGVEFEGSIVPLIKAGEDMMPLPWNCWDVESITLLQPNRVQLEERTPSWLAANFPTTMTGFPRFYAQVGQTAQDRPATSGGFINIFGSPVNNNISKVKIVYRKSNQQLGTYETEIVQGEFGTVGSVLTLSAAATGFSIQSVSVDENWSGQISVNVGGEEVAVLDPSKIPVETRRSEYARKLIQLRPTPDTNYSSTIAWKRIPTPLTKDDDRLELPFSEVIVYGVTAEMFRSDKDFDSAREYDGLANSALSDLSNSEDVTPDQAVPFMGNFLDQTGLPYHNAPSSGGGGVYYG